jgi:two-component system phosphate regulon response regulator PhoB
MRILVADDSPSLRVLIRRILDGHEVVEAGLSDEAVDFLGTASVGVAILDVTMPGRSGLEVCRAIRRDPLQTATVVLVITADGTPEDERRAIEAGADAFLAKPFSPRRLRELVDGRASAPAAHQSLELPDKEG